MSSLNLYNLINNRNEILKAEIGALLFNLGKTHAGIANWRKYFPNINSLFSSYKKYYEENHFEKELINADLKLKDFIFQEKVKLPDGTETDWSDFFKGDASSKDFIKKIFFRGCENINSGIDKGSPKEENQLETLWISNAFGTFKRTVEEKYFDEARYCFFYRFHRYLEDKHYYSNPDWQKIRNWIFDEVKSWYSRLLSDSRFPANDVTLFDQAYMTASMFKTILAGLFLNPSRYSDYIENPQTIKWSILGIQYDKLGLAEKGLKPASIKWYRDKSETTDNDIKKLLEAECVVGNEVYRDETGIYFVVAENLKGEKYGNFYHIHSDLDEIKEKIYEIFSSNFEGEAYPAILLTEPSRGLMNLGHLVEKAKENFLKAEYFKYFKEKSRHNSEYNGICQICKIRLAHKENKENLTCNICKKRLEGRIDNWVKNSKSETIWTDELQDKDGRIALVTLKFELEKWINGDLLNSSILRKEQFRKQLKNIKNFIYLFLSDLTLDFGINKLDDKIKEIVNNLKNTHDKNEKQKLGSEKGKIASLKRKVEDIQNLIEQIRNSNWFEKPLKNDLGIGAFTGKNFDGIFSELLKIYEQIKKEHIIEIFENVSMFPNELSSDAYNGCKNNDETFDDYIRQIFFGSIRGNIWENLIKSSFFNHAIDWEEEKIKWKELNNDDLNFISQILLQFLLRKNPSPARLRRVWETTREFFKELEDKIVSLTEIEENRQKRLIWNDIDIPDGEYKDGEILFWAKDKIVYLISSIEKIGDKKEFNLKKYNSTDNKIKATLQTKNAIEQIYKPYFTILNPTPISWQFIIPAKNLPELIKNVQIEYYKNFKWVYGKLPLHIGVIIQNYKKPLYIGIQALRKIRRDKIEWSELGYEISAKDFKVRQKIAFHYQETPEEISNCENFYSLFERINGEEKYEFYLYPEKKEKIWIDTTQNTIDTDKFKIYPNTIDFEFLDTNTRRNDIYYNKKGKRFLKLKSLRPYDLNSWQYFEKFKEYFISDKKSSSKLQKLVSLTYSKIDQWDNLESLKIFMISAFVNVLELKDDKDEFAEILGVNTFDELKEMNPEIFKEKLLMLIDMFEFWHTALKEV